jgi:hypothetical protein
MENLFICCGAPAVQRRRQPGDSPRQVADRTLENIANGVDHVRAHARSEEMWNLIRQNPEQVEESMHQAWDDSFEINGRPLIRRLVRPFASPDAVRNSFYQDLKIL